MSLHSFWWKIEININHDSPSPVSSHQTLRGCGVRGRSRGEFWERALAEAYVGSRVRVNQPSGVRGNQRAEEPPDRGGLFPSQRREMGGGDAEERAKQLWCKRENTNDASKEKLKCNWGILFCIQMNKTHSHALFVSMQQSSAVSGLRTQRREILNGWFNKSPEWDFHSCCRGMNEDEASEWEWCLGERRAYLEENTSWFSCREKSLHNSSPTRAGATPEALLKLCIHSGWSVEESMPSKQREGLEASAKLLLLKAAYLTRPNLTKHTQICHTTITTHLFHLHCRDIFFIPLVGKVSAVAVSHLTWGQTS